MKYYLDAGTTYSKIICLSKPICHDKLVSISFMWEKTDDKYCYILPSKIIKSLNLTFEKTCGHMGNGNNNYENEIVALAKGAQKHITKNAVVLDMGSRDAKWIRIKNGKFKDMDWNTSCASSTGATVEMLLKFYDIKINELKFNKEKFTVTCGIFGLEKIMD